IGGADSGNDAAQPPDSSTDTGGGNDAAPVDAPADSPGDASTFTPASVSGLVLWLEGSAGITQNGGAVSAWADQTSFMNNATQSTASLQPTIVASAINALPAVHFNKGNTTKGSSGQELVIAD